jgi:hypothetical protein
MNREDDSSHRDSTGPVTNAQGEELNLDDIRQEDRDQLLQDMNSDRGQD